MKGFKTRTVRPGSARPKTAMVPGVTEPSHPDLNLLMQDSKLKEIEFEKSRSKLLLHFEAKKSLDEKEILAKKYEDTIKSLNDSHNIRMKTLSAQHQQATETLIDQFTKEINMLKSSQKSQIDRLIQENESKLEDFQTKIEELQATHKHKLSKQKSDHTKSLKNLQESLIKDHENEINQLKDSFEHVKQELIQKSSQDRDVQIKKVINKLYEETRKDWKNQENKLIEEIRSLKFQLENLRLKNKVQEEIVRKSKENFFDGLSESKGRQTWELEKGENFSIWSEKESRVEGEKKKEKFEAGVQVDWEKIGASAQTEVNEGVYERVNEVKEEFFAIFEKIFEKVVTVVNSKNKTIAGLEAKINGLLVKQSELCALIKSLNT